MLTPNVGHGHAVAGCGNAAASPARASVPSAPPAKMAATSRRSTLGMLTASVRIGERPSAAARRFGSWYSASGHHLTTRVYPAALRYGYRSNISTFRICNA